MRQQDTTRLEFQTGEFSGPLHLLLTLIESEELPITDVSLSQVTEQYLAYLDEAEVPLEELADFLTIAARLLYLKSRVLLPEQPVEADEMEGDLALQLRLYKHFIRVAEHVGALYRESPQLHIRPKETLPVPEMIPFPEHVTSEHLVEVFRALLKSLRPFFALREETMARIKSVAERIVDVRDLLKKRANLLFSDLAGDAQSKAEVVVSFLALLELAKQKLVRARQLSTFRDITIERV